MGGLVVVLLLYRVVSVLLQGRFDMASHGEVRLVYDTPVKHAGVFGRSNTSQQKMLDANKYVLLCCLDKTDLQCAAFTRRHRGEPQVSVQHTHQLTHRGVRTLQHTAATAVKHMMSILRSEKNGRFEA